MSLFGDPELTTKTHYVACEKCHNNIDFFYTQYTYNILCENCTISIGGQFPDGAFGLQACKKCKEPNVNWFEINGWDDETDCGHH